MYIFKFLSLTSLLCLCGLPTLFEDEGNVWDFQTLLSEYNQLQVKSRVLTALVLQWTLTFTPKISCAE